MKPFAYIAPETLEEASALLKEEGSVLSAGGTDLVGVLKEKLLPAYPDRVISLKNVKGLDSIREETDGLHLGAAATLADISASGIVRESWGALADAAYSVASPNIRSSATVGGNICQDIRCWYYRYPELSWRQRQLRPQRGASLLRHDGREPLPFNIRRGKGLRDALHRQLPGTYGHLRLHGAHARRQN